MNIPIILIDVDDVINNLADKWVSKLNETYSLSLNVNDMTSWGITNYFPSLTGEQVYDPLSYRDFWMSLSPTKDSQYIIKTLIDDGFPVKFITASHYSNIKYKAEWLNIHYPFVGWKNTIIASEKQYIIGDIHIDDGLHNLSPTRKLNIIMDRPWNHSAIGNFSRVYNWREIYSNVMRYISKEGFYFTVVRR